MTYQLSPPTFTLLIVDDSLSDRAIYLRYLQSDVDFTYRFIEVETIDEGLELWRSQRPDLVLLDINLPDGDGLEFLSAIKPDLAGTLFPVIVLTGEGDERIVVRAMKMGAADYLIKGELTATSICTTVKQVLRESDLSRQLLRSQQQQMELHQSLQDLNESLEKKVKEHISELAASELRYRAIFNNTFQFTGLISPSGIVLDANQSALTFAGIQLEDVINYPFWETYWWSNSRENQEKLKQAIALAAQGEFIRYEVETLGANGQVASIDFSLRPIKDASGRVIMIIPEGRDISDRRQVELALAASEAKSRAILAAIPDLMFRLGADQVYRELITPNHEIAILPEDIDIVGLHASAVLSSAEMLQQQLYYLQQAIQTGELQVYEQQLCIDDRIRYEEVRIIKSGDDEALFMIRDISDRKQVEQELRQLNLELENRVEQRTAALKLSEGLLQEAQQVAHLGSWELDVATGKLSWSHELFEIFRINPETEVLTFEQLTPYFAPQDNIIRQELVSRAVQYAEPFEVDLQIVRADGTIGYVFSKGMPNTNEAGQVTRLFGTMMDISDRKKAEISLQESQKFIQTVVETIPIPLFWKNRESVFLGCNTQFAELFNFDSADAIVGKNDFDLCDIEAEAITYRKADREVMESGETKSHIVETFILPKNGKQIWLETHKAPLRDWANNVIGVVAMSQDITSRKLVEINLQQTNEQLLRATKLKDEFLANMSHEIRTPLNAILGISESLQEQIFGSLNAKQLKSIATIASSGKHLLELINDILDLSKILSGKAELNVALVSISSLCESSLVFIKQQAFQKRVKIVSSIPKNMGNINVEARRIRQVLINLLNNAVKFTPSGGQVSLSVAFGCGDSWQGDAKVPDQIKDWNLPTILFQVTDNGIGIASTDLERLFQPFVQVDSALNRKYEGTGLGLSLVKQIVELHGGQVFVESEVNKGSCFTVALFNEVIPPSSESTSEISITPSWVEKSDQAIAPLILLAEDNEANIQTFVEYLIAINYQIIIAKNGEEAVAMAKVHSPDIIIIDIQMPVMDGLEAICLIRVDEVLKNIPIIALTALVMEGDRERCLEAGANEYLTKPINLKQLSNTIQQLIYRRE